MMIVLYCFTKYWLLLHIALLHIVLSAGGRGTTLGTIIYTAAYVAHVGGRMPQRPSTKIARQACLLANYYWHDYMLVVQPLFSRPQFRVSNNFAQSR